MDTHKVQPGDTFAALARSYYGSERYTQYLIDQNPQVTNPSRLSPGMSIRIPARPAELPASAAPASTVAGVPAAPASTTPTGARTYRVRAGDTFYGIAREVLGSSSRWRELFELNRALVDGDPRNLRVGQVLTLPVNAGQR
ncbi:MAG TPA: LysM peptidoglycan-binding domain-containing protein [Phycisphaerae bacterium]|nr:LysM peptidoglycan-binding domain-containing protein [Phycisphaerae bacterium]HNU45286.1 LysM peptidoglycan-binding domain-containing protein [Phycisphaerae bacterium]